MTTKKVEFEITGDPSKLTSATGKAAEGFRKLGDDATSSVGKINSAFGNMHAQTAGKLNDISKSASGVFDNVLKASNVLGFLGTALAGISFVNKIRDQIDFADALNKTSQKSGVAVETMSSLSYAAKLADVDIQSLSSGVVKLSKTVIDAATGNREAAATFEAMKVSVKGANGEIRPTEDILLDLAGRFSKMEDGATKTALAMRLFGKSGAEMIPFLNQGKEGIQALQAEAEKFGIVISGETARAAEEFNDNLTRLKSAGQGLAIKLAGEVLPTLVAFTQGMVDARKAAIGVGTSTKGVAQDNEFLDFLGDAAIGTARLADVLKLIPSLIKSISGSFQVVAADIGAFGKTVNAMALTPSGMVNSSLKLFKGENPYAEAAKAISDRQATLDKANKSYGDLWNKPANGMETAVTKSIEALRAKRAAAKNGDEPASNKPDDPFKPDMGALAKGNKTEKESSRMPEWQNQLEQEKLALDRKNQLEGTDIQYSLEREAQFWLDKKNLTEAGSNERYAVESKYFTAQKQLSRDSFAGQIAQQKMEIADLEKNYQGALQIAESIAEKMKEHYGADSKHYADAQREVINIQKQFREQQRQLLDLQIEDTRSARANQVSIDKEEAQMQYDLGGITRAELLQQEREFQRQMYEIDREALQAKLAQIDPTKDPVTYDQVNNQLLEQERAFQLAKHQIQNQLRVENAQPEVNVWKSAEKEMNGFLDNTLMRTKSWRQQIGSSFSSLGVTFMQEMINKPLVAWLMKEAGMTAATGVGVLTRTTAEVAGAATSTSVRGATALTNITTTAYETAANVYNSIAAIPYVGPFLAPAMAIGAVGTVLAFAGKIASASGGYDIPSGVNPLVQAHAEEMILPAKYANGFRNIIEGGGGGAGGNSGGAGGSQYHYNDYSGRLTPSEIKRNAKLFADALKDHSKKS